MNSLPIRNYLTDCMANAGLSLDDFDGPTGSPERLVRLILDGIAKMPLDKVADVAVILGCDARELFRAALAQFYSADTIELMERMLGPQERSIGEQAWVDFIRRAAPDRVEPPNRFARRLLWTLLNRTI
ncbi:hypothetical protein [Agrobacterium cavarae]|uniref:hypothetical protein n=1 Tax=Agrobacterium cavarae TaxID=2528239 RepID=UPI0028AD61E9|nr:hypothetical protein [Agrobacterium cavarae]